MKLSKGVIYTAENDVKYLKEALYSIKSLKKYNPNLQVTLFTNISKDIKFKWIDNLIYYQRNTHPLKSKIINFLNSPYYYTLYLDVDTEIKAPIYELFDFLLVYDIGLTHMVNSTGGKQPQFIAYIRENYFNTGFLLYKKNEKVMRLLKLWLNEISKIPDKDIKLAIMDDQIVFNKMINQRIIKLEELKYVFLPNKVYNARPRMWRQVKEDGEWKQIKIFHAHNLNAPKIKILWDKAKHKIRTMKKNV